MNTTITSFHPIRFGLAVLALAALLLMPLRAADGTLTIQVKCSPAVVILDSVANGNCMTVHTDLRYSKVDRTQPIELNGLPATAVFSDSRGQLVAKFDLTVLKTMLTVPATTLTLTGRTTDGLQFIGADEVRVIE
ncbi:MAG: hypothetical protein KIS67_07650 [Verrucomicrobiae bacterium]|nr:hypothetical protein [Verrucomicrobiae bacterium]